MEGDIVLAEADEEVPARIGEAEPMDPSAAVPYGLTRVSTSYTWPQGVVPYEIASVLADYTAEIERGMAMWEDATRHYPVPLHFVRRTSAHSDYVTFIFSDECSSRLGRGGGRQFVRLAEVCAETPGSVAHELGHAMGLHHEHTRPDRNDYVKVNWEYIELSHVDNFLRHTTRDTRQIGSYDWDSIMHYHQVTFLEAEYESANEPFFEKCDENGISPLQCPVPFRTLAPAHANWTTDVGQRSHLSAGDVFAVEDYHRGEALQAITVHQHIEFGGYSVALPAQTASYTLSALRARGVQNDDLSSMRLPQGYVACLYQHDHFGGHEWVLAGDEENFVSLGANDQVSSMKIERSVTVFQHSDYRGYGVDLPVGAHRLSDLRALGMVNDDISSIRIPAGLRVRLYRHDGFVGELTLSSDQRNLSDFGFNDEVSSIIVERE